jgi:acyl transferase domain-containing protein
MSRFEDEIAALSPKRLALLCMELKAQLERAQPSHLEPIAVIGMGCRFPGGASSPETFWRLLRDGVDASREVPAERWDTGAYFDPDPAAAGKMYTSRGGFLDRVDAFDPEFFGISPREARSLDPQHRLLLEVGWEALEHAGLAVDRLAGTLTGVFVGIGIDDYAKLQLKTLPASAIDAYTGTGNAFCFAAGRLSYLLGLQGPSMALDTACSTSLVTIHLACQSLRARECALALAGGVNLMLAPEPSVFLSKARALAPDGRCKTFDAAADGYGRGEGCGMLVLKRLSDALADGDDVLAVIRGSAVNHDGASSGLTVPNGLAQQAVIRAALAQAEVAPADVSYVEAHGTGTALGDPIEVRALQAVLSSGRTPDRPLWLGSVKTNIGHLEVAAGVASVIKVVTALQHATIPPHLHFRHANPHLVLDQIPARIPTRCEPWPRASGARIAGVSSFGLSGTNAHLILQEAPASSAPAEARQESPAAGAHLLALSARDAWSLRTLAEAYREALAEGGALRTVSLHAVCYAAGARRAHHRCRWAAVVSSHEQACRELEAAASGMTSEPKPVAHKLAFVFSGQGSQWAGMGRALLAQRPVFRASLNACDEMLRRLGGPSALEELQRDAATSRLGQTQIAQPVLFALQVALARLLESWGVRPDAVVGHSVGEIAAAHVAGALGLEDATRLALVRGRVMQRASGQGRMAAVELAPHQAEELVAAFGGRLSVAAVNGPRSAVLSGEPAALDQALARLDAIGVRHQLLPVDYAFHSYQMRALEGALLHGLEGLDPQPASIPIFSTVTGREHDGSDFTPDYWGRNLTQPVRFSDAMQALIVAGHDVFLEIGAHPVLSMPIAQCLAHADREGSVLCSLRRGEEEGAALLETLRVLYVLGLPIEFRALYPAGGRMVDLPTYPWHRRRVWFDPPAVTMQDRLAAGAPLVGRRLHSPAIDTSVYAVRASASARDFLADHRVLGNVLLPATGFLEMALSAAAEAFGTNAVTLENFGIQRALVMDADAQCEIQTVVKRSDPGAAVCQIFSRAPQVAAADGAWTLHAAGSITASSDSSSEGTTLAAPELPPGDSTRLPVEEFYARLRQHGFDFGPGFRGIRQMWRTDECITGYVELPEPLRPGAGAYRVHPALLDACFHLLAATFSDQEQAADQDAFLPVGLRRLRVIASPGTEVWCEARRRPGGDPDSVTGDLRLFDRTGSLLVEVEGLWFRRGVARFLAGSAERPDGVLYDLRWHAVEPVAPPSDSQEQGAWLLFADRDGTALALAQALRARGDTCALVTPAPGRVSGEGDDWTVDPASVDSFRTLLRQMRAAYPRCRGIAYCWALDPATDTAEGLARAAEHACRGLLHLVQGLAAAVWSAQPRLWVITRGCQAVVPGRECPAIAQASVWGMARAIVLEKPELECASIDLDPLAGAREVDPLVAEMVALARDDQVALRAGRRFLPRIHRRRSTRVERLSVPDSESICLESGQRGVLDRLELRPAARRRPGAGEVELRVHASGLNFKDVLSALGMYPGDAGPLGSECAGEVVAVGAGVTTLKEGDAVIAFAPGSFARFVTTRADYVVPKPAALDFETAAALPIAFITASYALMHLARLRSGQRVLIHAAAGGVGLAAVQLAQRAGAEIFATAGSPRKRRFLHSLGVQHVMDSRSLDFAQDVRSHTGEAGVDVVLNCLAGEFVRPSLALVRPGGCFVELGKTDVLERHEAVRLRPDVSYHLVALDRVAAEDSAVIRSLLRELSLAFDAGTLVPPPRRVFPLEQAVDAFRFMAQARHIGKLVLSQERAGDGPTAQASLFKADATYLITGGLGALGLTLVPWMVEEGARNLVLMGRSAPRAQAETMLQAARDLGARVIVAQGDVAWREDVERVLADIARALPGLKGVVHAAGVLEDGVLEQQPWERFAAVFPAKLQGAWNLHALTEPVDLDFFVLFSSVAAVTGSPGQAGYCAANACLDALAHHRRALGLPALSVDWGPWSQRGLATEVGARGQARWAAMGVGTLQPAHAHATLTSLLREDATQALALSVDWSRLVHHFPRGEHAALLAEMAAEAARAHPAAHAVSSPPDLARRLRGVPVPEANELLREFLCTQVAQLLGFDPAQTLDTGQGLLEMGMDSLMAVDLRNRLFAALGRSLPPTLVFDYPSIDALAGYLARETAQAPAPRAAAAPAVDASVAGGPALESVLEQLEGLSEE